MAWTEQTTNAAASNVVTLAVTSGDLIFVGLGWGSGTLADLTSISDDASNTYTLLTGAADSGNSQASRGGWAVAGTTATITITGNGIGGFSFLNALAVSYREAGTLSFVDQSTGFAVFGTGTDAVTTGNVTPAVDDLIVCFTQNTGFGALTINPGTGYTLSVANAANPSRMCLIEYKIATSASAQAATATHSNNSEEALFVAVFNGTGAGAPTTTIVTGSATAAVGIAETYTYTLDASPAGTVTVTPTAPVAGSWSPTTVGLTSGNWNTGLTSNFTASAAGSGNIASTNDGGLTNDTLAVTVYSTSRPSAVTPNTWTDEAGGSLVVADINDASDSTGAKDPAGASYPVLAFTMDTPMAASVSQTCYFRGDNVAAGKQVRQVLFANDGTTVVATGAWKTMTGSLATYSDVLTPTATAYKGEIQTQAVPSAVYGVIWPSNPDTNSDVRLNWTGSASVSRTAQTIIWKANYAQQDGYYAVWWRLPDAASSFTATEWHFGTHPWPGSTSVNGAGEATGGTGSTGTVHQQEIATIGASVDYLTSPSAANGGPFTVTKGVWITSAATVEVISGTTLRHTYWPDISNTTSFIRQDRTLASLNTPTSERVVFGGSPWTADDPTSGKNSESASGTFRYWKMFSAALSITDIATEAASESDSAVTTAGIASAFYSNINPTPTDVTDKSGNGNDPAWANSNRPTLYTG